MSKSSKIVVEPEVITKTQMTDIATTNFLQYALAVITNRALPSFHDGLKPVQRRILWTMLQGKFNPAGPFVKSARIIGDTLGKYHPHADGSVYGAMVNMTDEYMLVPLVSSQGNFGTRGEDKAAAMRYTEAKLHPNAVDLYLSDLDERCVDFFLNYDQSREEPASFPTKAPMLMVNGSFGIAVGVGTSIPSHNLAEVVEITKHLINGDEKKAFDAFKGPDWKSGGSMYCDDATRHKIFHSGKGTIRVYGKIETTRSTKKSVPSTLEVWEVPWTTTSQDVVDKLITLKDEIPDMKIERSSKEGEPLITISSKDDIERLEKLVMKKTGLSSTYSYNVVFLDGKIPQQRGLLPMLYSWIEFRKSTLRKKFHAQLEKTQSELDFLEAKYKLTDKLFDKFIYKLRNEGRKNAKEFLISALQTTDIVAERILGIRIASFSKDSDAEFILKRDEFRDTKIKLEELISDAKVLDKYIKAELRTAQKLSEPRRTVIRTEEIIHTERIPSLTMRKIHITAENKVSLGVGERYPLTYELAILTSTETFRLRVKDFQKYRDGATVDIATLGTATTPILAVLPKAKYALLVYTNGRAVWIDFTKVKESSAVRKLENSPISKVFYYDEMPEEFLVVLTTKGQIIVNKISELGMSSSRVLAKLRVAGIEVEQLLTVPYSAVIKATFRKGLSELFSASDYYRGKFSVQALKLSADKEVKMLSVKTTALAAKL